MDVITLESKLRAPPVVVPDKRLNYHYITDSEDVKYLSDYIMTKPAQAVDSETTGLDPIENRPILFQIGDENKQFVINTTKASIEPLRPWLEDESTKKVGHNLLFDYLMIKSGLGISVENPRCTFLAETVLTIGKVYGKKKLSDVALKYIEVVLDKQMQQSFVGHDGIEFTKSQIEYSAIDVRDPIRILQQQSNQIIKDGLVNTFLLECLSIPAFGDMRLNGMKLDTALWQRTIDNNRLAMQEAKKKMDEIVEPFWGRDLFGNITINYDSPSQVLQLLQMMNVKVKEWDKEKKDWKMVRISNTSKQTQKKIMHLPLIKALSEYRGKAKLISTYGSNFYDCIRSDGRIHPELKQIGTETGRPAAGEDETSRDLFSVVTKKARNPGDKLPDINPLNIPARSEYRHSFIADEDKLIETDDYSGCEMRILAELSLDPKLLYVFDNDIDVHCYVASDLYGVEVTKDNSNKKLRKPAKSLNFGWLIAA